MLDEKDEEKIWEELKKEFPDDEMMQEIHFVRIMHYFKTRNIPLHDKVKFYNPKTA